MFKYFEQIIDQYNNTLYCIVDMFEISSYCAYIIVKDKSKFRSST